MGRVPRWAEYLAEPEDDAIPEAPRRHQRAGHESGGEPFIKPLAAVSARYLRPGNRRPKPG